MTNRSDIRKVLEGWGLTDNPAEYGDGIHGWRCEHPDRYGRCDCFEDAVTDIMKLIYYREHRIDNRTVEHAKQWSE